MDPFFEEVRLFLVPVLHGLKGWDVAKRLLSDVLIIDLDVAFDGSGQMLGGVEAVVAKTSAMRPLKRSIIRAFGHYH